MFVLIHSPLVGPFTWALVAEELRQRGIEVIVPNLHVPDREARAPYWAQHAAAIALALTPQPDPLPVVLVGHSGAGILLPAVRELTERPVSAYLFVDAGIPENGKSRLDLLRREASQLAEEVENKLKAGERLPQWTDEDLRAIVPTAEVRQHLLAELHPQPFAFMTEPIPVFDRWPDAPCAYLQFSPVYDKPAERARQMGWVYRKMDGGHFHMLVEPKKVAEALIELTEVMGVANFQIRIE